MTFPPINRRPFRAVAYALIGTFAILFSALVFYVSRKDQGAIAFLNSLFVGTLFLSGGIYLYWRSWLNAAGTAERYSIDYTSPVGRAIVISVIAAKGLSDLAKTQIGKHYLAIVLVGIAICVIAPIVVWLRTRGRTKHAAKDL